MSIWQQRSSGEHNFWWETSSGVWESGGRAGWRGQWRMLVPKESLENPPASHSREHHLYGSFTVPVKRHFSTLICDRRPKTPPTRKREMTKQTACVSYSPHYCDRIWDESNSQASFVISSRIQSSCEEDRVAEYQSLRWLVTLHLQSRSSKRWTMLLSLLAPSKPVQDLTPGSDETHI